MEELAGASISLDDRNHDSFEAPMRTVSLLPLLTLLPFGAACAVTATTEPIEAPADPEVAVTVVPLKFAVADELAKSVRGASGPLRVRVDSYPRTNSLILSGPREGIEEMQRLIATLDVEAK